MSSLIKDTFKDRDWFPLALLMVEEEKAVLKEQILNLECLKEEKTESEDAWVCPECSCYGGENEYCCLDGKKLVNKHHIWESDKDLTRNQLRREIKEVINNLNK